MIDDAIESLKRALDEDHEPVAKKIAAAGFLCKRCGKCCKREWGDNTVTVFPGEIRSIMGVTGLSWLEVARPMESCDKDECGAYHTFEWALQKQKNGDCIFLKDGACRIYDARPLLCRTYPMRLESGRLELYECDGLGSGRMAMDEAERIAGILHDRRVRELNEAILLLQKLEPIHVVAGDSSGDKVYVVHDSEGSRRVLSREDGSFSFL